MVDEIENLDGITSVVAYEKFAGPMIPSELEPDAIRDVLEANGRKLILVNTSYRSATDELNNQIEDLVFHYTEIRSERADRRRGQHDAAI